MLYLAVSESCICVVLCCNITAWSGLVSHHLYLLVSSTMAQCGSLSSLRIQNTCISLCPHQLHANHRTSLAIHITHILLNQLICVVSVFITYISYPASQTWIIWNLNFNVFHFNLREMFGTIKCQTNGLILRLN